MQSQTASSTAEFMALFRALESVRPPPERLFEDPLATRFLRRSLRLASQLAAAPIVREGLCRVIDTLWPGARSAGIARTRLIDDALREALGLGIRQVVILGVGFDCRAYRLPELAGVRVFEVDHPATLAERRRRLAATDAKPLGAVVPVAVDFDREVLGLALERSGFERNRRTLFVLEGVTNYLTVRGVDGLLAFVARSAPGSRLIFTYVHRDAIERPARYEGSWLLRRTLRRTAEPWCFGIDPAELADFLRRRGLSLVRDEGSLEYRERLMGERGGSRRGYAFYRTALADVG